MNDVPAEFPGAELIRAGLDEPLSRSPHRSRELHRPIVALERMFVPFNTTQERRLTMPTGKKAASAAGKVLANPKSTKADKAAAASDLAQAPHKGGKKK